MEENENIEEMFSRFRILIAGLRVLNKRYTTTDHVIKIIRSLPAKWRHMVTTLEELISSLISHEIELDVDEEENQFNGSEVQQQL
jgi:hypothetical protein